MTEEPSEPEEAGADSFGADSSGGVEVPKVAAESSALLQRCLDGTREAWSRRYPQAVSDRVVSRSLRELGTALASSPGSSIPHSVREPASLLGVRRGLLDLMRGEYLRGIEDGSDRSDGAAAHLARLRRFEEVREALEPEWNEQIEAGLSGPRAHELLAEIGHDLRSPLTSILFLSEVLKDSQGIRDDDHQVRQLGLVYSGALTMLNIVNNFMELVRSGEGLSNADPTVFSLSELMDSTHRTVQPMAQEKGLALETTQELTGTDRRVGHPVLLSRVLLNLATNALKFTDTGEVRLGVEEPAPGILEFSVSDSGSGIDPEKRDAIFNVFDPAQDRSEVKFSGSGLGLVIVRRLLASLGSRLECESEVGHGTRMWFRIALESRS